MAGQPGQRPPKSHASLRSFGISGAEPPSMIRSQRSRGDPFCRDFAKERCGPESRSRYKRRCPPGQACRQRANFQAQRQPYANPREPGAAKRAESFAAKRRGPGLRQLPPAAPRHTIPDHGSPLPHAIVRRGRALVVEGGSRVLFRRWACALCAARLRRRCCRLVHAAGYYGTNHAYTMTPYTAASTAPFGPRRTLAACTIC